MINENQVHCVHCSEITEFGKDRDGDTLCPECVMHYDKTCSECGGESDYLVIGGVNRDGTHRMVCPKCDPATARVNQWFRDKAFVPQRRNS
jgi:alpha-D-ribose 1-methylphosphonate 5-phosphate C-P lyase